MTAPYWLNPESGTDFPDIDLALQDPDGLLAVGGDLSIERLVTAYRSGIFPWYSEGQPIMWWSPDPRSVLLPENLKVSRSLRKTIKKHVYEITLNQAFENVITQCAKPRRNDQGTWITRAMKAAYCRLHRAGHAISVEAWHDGKLVGGLYGVVLGRVFFGESMFARMPDASKVAFVQLARQLQRWGFELIDCQVETAHLNSLGATNIPRSQFIQYLDQWCDIPAEEHDWQFDEMPG